MKTLAFILILSLASVAASFANLGDSEKQLRARYAKKPVKIVEFTNTGGTNARGLVYKERSKTVIVVLLDGISSAEFFFPELSEQEISTMKLLYSKGQKWNSQNDEDTTTWTTESMDVSIYDVRNKGVSVMFRSYEEYGERDGRFVRDQVHKLLRSSIPGY